MKELKLFLTALFVAVSLANLAFSGEKEFRIDLNKIFGADDVYYDEYSGPGTQSYTFATDTSFEECKKRIVRLLGDGWGEVEVPKTIPKKNGRERIDFHKRFGDRYMQVWLTHEERETWVSQTGTHHPDKKFFITILISEAPVLKFTKPEVK